MICRRNTEDTCGLCNDVRRMPREIEICRDCVLEFFKYDDNFRCNPGKRDALKINGETQQTRTLTAYLKSFYLKFLVATPNVKLS